MKITELSNSDLDKYVAIAQGWEFKGGESTPGGKSIDPYWKIDDTDTIDCFYYKPSTNGGQAMELVEQDKIELNYDKYKKHWEGCWGEGDEEWCTGPTAAIAACRAKVASVFGDEVEEE